MNYPLRPLASIVEVAAGGGAPQRANAFGDIGTPFVRAGSLPALVSGASESTLEHIRDDVAKEHRLRKFPPNTVVFAKSGMSATKGHVYRLRGDAYVVNHLAALLPDDEVSPEYLEHSLRVFSPVGLIQDAAYPSIRLSEVGGMTIPLPPLPEQKRIAAILDKADAIRRRRREALRLTGDFLRALFLEMFGDLDEWAMQTVDTMLADKPNAIRTGPFGSQLLHSEFVDTGIAVLGIDNAVHNEFRWGKSRFITPEKYAQLQRYTVHPGDLIITIMGTVGRCAVVPTDIPPAINTKHLCCLTLDWSKCLPDFLHAYFLFHPVAHRHLRQSCKGAIMDGLNMGVIKSLPVPLVPVPLQQRFKEIAGRLKLTAGRASTHAVEAEGLFQSLQQRAFTGAL